MQTGGVREQLSSPSLPFCGRVPPSPSVSYGSGILACRLGRCLPVADNQKRRPERSVERCYSCATGTPHPLFSLDEKRGEKNQKGWHLDTPSEIILQASLRMHFDGGQGSFFNAPQRHRETTRSLALLLFSHSGSLRGRKARS